MQRISKQPPPDDIPPPHPCQAAPAFCIDILDLMPLITGEDLLAPQPGKERVYLILFRQLRGGNGNRTYPHIHRIRMPPQDSDGVLDNRLDLRKGMNPEAEPHPKHACSAFRLPDIIGQFRAVLEPHRIAEEIAGLLPDDKRQRAAVQPAED